MAQGRCICIPVLVCQPFEFCSVCVTCPDVFGLKVLQLAVNVVSLTHSSSKFVRLVCFNTKFFVKVNAGAGAGIPWLFVYAFRLPKKVTVTPMPEFCHQQRRVSGLVDWKVYWGEGHSASGKPFGGSLFPWLGPPSEHSWASLAIWTGISSAPHSSSCPLLSPGMAKLPPKISSRNQS